MIESMGVETIFGTFTKIEAVNLRLSRDRLIGKPLLSFDPKLSKFDFSTLLNQLINTGVRIHWYNSKLLTSMSGAHDWNHIAVVDETDINLIKLITDNVRVYSTDQLYEEIG